MFITDRRVDVKHIRTVWDALILDFQVLICSRTGVGERVRSGHNGALRPVITPENTDTDWIKIINVVLLLLILRFKGLITFIAFSTTLFELKTHSLLNKGVQVNY